MFIVEISLKTIVKSVRAEDAYHGHTWIMDCRLFGMLPETMLIYQAFVNKLQWTWDQMFMISSPKNTFSNFRCKLGTILF